MLGEDPLSRHLLQKLFGKHTFDNGKKSFNENAHMIKITFLHAPPNAWPIANDNRQGIE